jgi:hypothetical protein
MRLPTRLPLASPKILISNHKAGVDARLQISERSIPARVGGFHHQLRKHFSDALAGGNEGSSPLRLFRKCASNSDIRLPRAIRSNFIPILHG